MTIAAKLWISREIETDLLDDLPRLLEVCIVPDRDIELLDHPVAAHVLHGAQLAERGP